MSDDIQDCKDILIDLADDGIKYNVSVTSSPSNDKMIIDISDNYTRIELKKYSDNFERLFDFLASLGYKLDSESYYEGDGWDYYERCPNCHSQNLDRNNSGMEMVCRDCHFEDDYSEFQTPEHPLTKGDLMWSVKSGDKPEHMYLVFIK